MRAPPLARPPCPTCPLGACVCPSAATIARRAGVILPDDRTARTKGGHMGDFSRGGFRTQAKRMGLEAEGSLRIRTYGEWVDARLAAISLAPLPLAPELEKERKRLEMFATFIRLKFRRDPPAGVKELGALYGHNHDWAVHVWAEIRDAASGRPKSVPVLAVACKACGKPMVRFADEALGSITCGCEEAKMQRVKRRRPRPALPEEPMAKPKPVPSAQASVSTPTPVHVAPAAPQGPPLQDELATVRAQLEAAVAHAEHMRKVLEAYELVHAHRAQAQGGGVAAAL